VYRSTLASAAIASALIAAPSIAAAQQRSDLVISPFVSFLPTVGGNPLAGLALTLAGSSGLGLRASAHLALESSPAAGFGMTNTLSLSS